LVPCLQALLVCNRSATVLRQCFTLCLAASKTALGILGTPASPVVAGPRCLLRIRQTTLHRCAAGCIDFGDIRDGRARSKCTRDSATVLGQSAPLLLLFRLAKQMFGQKRKLYGFGAEPAGGSRAPFGVAGSAPVRVCLAVGAYRCAEHVWAMGREGQRSRPLF